MNDYKIRICTTVAAPEDEPWRLEVFDRSAEVQTTFSYWPTVLDAIEAARQHTAATLRGTVHEETVTKIIKMEELYGIDRRVAEMLRRGFFSTDEKLCVIAAGGRPFHLDAGWHHNEEFGYLIGKSAGRRCVIMTDAITGFWEVES